MYDCKPVLTVCTANVSSLSFPTHQSPTPHPMTNYPYWGVYRQRWAVNPDVPSDSQRGARGNQDVSPVNPSGHLQLYSGGDDGWLVVMHVAPLAQLFGWTRQASPTYWQSSPVHPGEQTHCGKIGHTHLCVQISQFIPTLITEGSSLRNEASLIIIYYCLTLINL